MITTHRQIELQPLRLVAEQPGYWSVFFARPQNFVFEAGDWIDLHFNDRSLRGGVTYSLSSSPTESDLRITFREGISEFKRALQSIQPSDQLTILQYGNDYGFQLKKNQSSVLIAGGVGIAPFRSMLKEMYDTKSKETVLLIYLNQSRDYLFKDELDVWADALPNVSIAYVSTKELSRKKREKHILSLIKNYNQNFYISGPPAMVESHEHLLIDAGVPVRDIRIDSFGGY